MHQDIWAPRGSIAVTIIYQRRMYELAFQPMFFSFKHVATIMCDYHFAIKSMFLLCATHQINKCTLQQQVFSTIIASGIITDRQLLKQLELCWHAIIFKNTITTIIIVFIM